LLPENRRIRKDRKSTSSGINRIQSNENFYLTAMIGVFLLLDINGAKAQKGMQAEFLMNALKAGYAKGALINVRNVDSVNYSDTLDSEAGQNPILGCPGNSYSDISITVLVSGVAEPIFNPTFIR
jgi:hypothetical protein